MESSYLTPVNRTEARQWLSMAETMLTDQDWSGCKKCAARAREMDPTLSRMVDEITVIANTLQAGTRRTAMDKPDWYGILGLTPSQGLNPEVVANRYRNLTYILNPRRNKFPLADRAIGIVHEAWAILSDPTHKSAYDRVLGFHLRPPHPRPNPNTVVNDPVAALQLNFRLSHPNTPLQQGGASTSTSFGHLPTNLSPPPAIVHNQQRVEPLVGGSTSLPKPTGDFNWLSIPRGSGTSVIPIPMATSQPPPTQVHSVVGGSTRLAKPPLITVTDFNQLFSPGSGTTPSQPPANFNLLVGPGGSGTTTPSGMSQPAQPPPTMSSFGNNNLLFRPVRAAGGPVEVGGPSMSSTAAAADCNLAFMPGSGPNSLTWPDFPRIDTASVLREEQWHVLESRLLKNHWDGIRLNDANKFCVVAGKVVQVEEKRSNLSFRTMCPSCRFVHQCPTGFVNLAMKCQNCSLSFIAVEIKSPPLVNVPCQEAYYAGSWNVAGPSSPAPPQAGETSGMRSSANIADKNEVTVEILGPDGDDGQRVKEPRLLGDENANADNAAAAVDADQAPEMPMPDFGIDPDEFFTDFGEPALVMSQETWQEDDIKEDTFEDIDEYLRSFQDTGAKAGQ